VSLLESKRKHRTATLQKGEMSLRLLRIEWVKRCMRVALGRNILLRSGVIAREISVEIDLQEQRHTSCKMVAQFSHRPSRVDVWAPDQDGSFTVLEKERNHYSSIYGKTVDQRNTVVADADADMQVPHGGRFIPPDALFMRFTARTECTLDIYQVSCFARLCPNARQYAITFLMPYKSALR